MPGSRRTIGGMKVVVELTALAFGLLPLVAAIAVLIGGVRRLRGRRGGPIDRVGALTGSAVGRGIYPESLRGGGPIVPVPPSRPIRRRRRAGA